MNTTEEINLQIDSNEIVVRGMSTPFHYSQSKDRLHENIFTPPRDSLLVSMNRLRYADAHYCKKQAKTIRYPNESNYLGLVTLLVSDLYEMNQKNNREFPFIVASPMKDNSEYYDLNSEKVYIDSEGNPAHCDLCYLESNDLNEPKTSFRKIAKQVVALAKYYLDPNPIEDEWKGALPLHSNYYNV